MLVTEEYLGLSSWKTEYRMNTYFMPENILSSNIQGQSLFKKRFNFIVCTLG